MARRDDLEIFAKEHGLKIGTIADLINYRMTHEQTVEEVASYPLSTEYGDFTAYRFKEYGATETHLALVKGNPSEGISTVRVHSFQPLRDTFAVKNKQTGNLNWSVQSALKAISNSERGVFVWIGDNQAVDLGEALDNFMHNQPNSTNLAQHQPYRTIGVGAQILRHLGVRDMTLLSSPLKFNALSGFDLNVVNSIACPDNV